MENFIATQSKINDDTSSAIQQIQAHNKIIDNQRAQMAQQLSNLSKPSGQLPSNTEKNTSGHVNAVTLRSGTTYNPPPMVVVENEEEEVVIEEEAPDKGKKRNNRHLPQRRERSPPLMYIYLLFLSHKD